MQNGQWNRVIGYNDLSAGDCVETPYGDFLVSQMTSLNKREFVAIERTGKTSKTVIIEEYQHTKNRTAFLAPLVAEVKKGNEAILSTLLRGVYSAYCVGGDPEIFVTDKDGVIAPAFDFLPLGNKKGDSDMFADGFAVEINPEAGGCLSYVVDRTHDLLQDLSKRVSLRHFLPSAKNVFDIPQDIMGRATEEQVQLGCAPTFNVYGLRPNLVYARQQFTRSAGGHIHFGLALQDSLLNDDAENRFKNPDRETVAWLENGVRGLDAILGVLCVSLFEGFDDPRRRLHYGQAGEYRIPKHGLEYRTLSNAWLMHPVLMHMVYDLARIALRVGLANIPGLLDDEQEVVAIIQDCDVAAARAYMRKHKRFLKAVMVHTSLRSGGKYDGELAFNKFYEGAHSFIAEPENIWKNWGISPHRPWERHSEGTNCSWYRSQVALEAGEKI